MSLPEFSSHSGEQQSAADIEALREAKGLLRHAVEFRRGARPAEARAERDTTRLALLQQFLQPSLAPDLTVAAYLSHGTEPSTLAMVSWLSAHRIPVLLPVLGPPAPPAAETSTPAEPHSASAEPVESGAKPEATSADPDSAQLTPDWARYEGPERLQTGRFSILQPMSPPLGAAALGEADVIICPGVAGSPSGQRLGRGAGWYDRALAYADPRTPICLLLNDEEVMDELPIHLWDRPVDVIITPTRVIDCSDG